MPSGSRQRLTAAAVGCGRRPPRMHDQITCGSACMGAPPPLSIVHRHADAHGEQACSWPAPHYPRPPRALTPAPAAVEWRDTDTPGVKAIASDTTISVGLVIPSWFVLPKAVVRSTGNTVIAAILSASVPRFLEQLEKDYTAWAAGDVSRKPLGNGELL